MDKKNGIRLENRLTTLENQFIAIMAEIQDIKTNHLHEIKENTQEVKDSVKDINTRINWLMGIFLLQFFGLLSMILMYLLNKK